MAHLRVLPHRVANRAAISIVRWWCRREGGAIQELPDQLEGWDYSSQTIIGADVEINLMELAESTGLSADSIGLVIVVDCPAVAERFLEKTAITHGNQSLSVELPRGRGAAYIVASLHLVANQSGQSRLSTKSPKGGSRLFDSEPKRVKLEGTGDRFPVELCKFSSIGFESAPWTLITDFDDLSDSFMGSVRLFVNSEHPLGVAVSTPSRDATAALLMKLDTMRLLIAEIARSNVYDSEFAWPDESVAHVVDSMCSFYFKRRLSTMIELLTSEPATFERILYDSTSFSEVGTL